MADIGGMWIVGFWVMMFNVAMYFAFKANDFIWRSKAFAISAANVSAVMIIPVLLYGLFAINKWSDHTEGKLQISIIPTQFESEYLSAFENQKDVIESTLHRTDSLAYDLINAGKGSDLYVWPETGTSYWMAFPNTASLLMEATDDWSGALLTGCTGIPVEDNDKQVYVTGVMLSPFIDSSINRVQYHHKTSLSPGGETIPYRKALEPYLDSTYANRIHYASGTSYSPLQLKTKGDPAYTPGISLCYEQWAPKAWTRQVANGATFFVHMAAEGWYGDIGFQQFMANVTRFRAVENRRSVARSSNKGLSMFINATGKSYGAIPAGSMDLSTADIHTSSSITLYSGHPDVFPIGCLAVVFMSILLSIFRIRKTALEKQHFENSFLVTIHKWIFRRYRKI